MYSNSEVCLFQCIDRFITIYVKKTGNMFSIFFFFFLTEASDKQTSGETSKWPEAFSRKLPNSVGNLTNACILLIIKLLQKVDEYCLQLKIESYHVVKGEN